MARRRGAHEPHLHERIAEKAPGNRAPDREIDLACDQRFVRPAEHGLVDLHARVGLLIGKGIEAFEQQPGRIDHLDGETDLRFLAAGELGSRAFEPGCFGDERLSSPIEQLAGRRERRLAALELEYLEPELLLELLDRVGDRRLGPMQALRGACVTAGLDDRHQRAPLIQANARKHLFTSSIDRHEKIVY